ncbi:hypothetical protein [Maribacter ulvicola]|uniref:Uncharacterized protein n=1 Tax=Maribacter ulvicola TaxID=228959 RepID=A0A1N6RN95_9FLAO|nr:hypothetical protein [Maribacter ulvicola]SIQ30146.1 hypothetical protein SAMN05421797_1011341 [Maribacter ulvicola]
MDFKTMLQLPVLEISQVLKTLQGIANEERNKEKPQMPNVSISTSTGHVSGYFINYDTEKNIVLLGNWYDHKADLQYVELHSIASISLGNINNYLYQFSDGAIPFVPNEDEVPTLLQLKKEIRDLEQSAEKMLGKAVAINYAYEEKPEDLEKYYATKIISILKGTLMSIAADPLAKEAFINAINELSFRQCEENKVSLENGNLSISLDLSKGLKTVASINKLQDLIEKCL